MYINRLTYFHHYYFVVYSKKTLSWRIIRKRWHHPSCTINQSKFTLGPNIKSKFASSGVQQLGSCTTIYTIYPKKILFHNSYFNFFKFFSQDNFFSLILNHCVLRLTQKDILRWLMEQQLQIISPTISMIHKCIFQKKNVFGLSIKHTFTNSYLVSTNFHLDFHFHQWLHSWVLKKKK